MHAGTSAGVFFSVTVLSLQYWPWMKWLSDIAAQLLFPQHSCVAQFRLCAVESASYILYQFLLSFC